MNNIIRNITGNLIELLPDNQQYYKPEDLRSWGVPDFIVQRIQVELERNLAESMRLPATDWANMQSAAVQDIWRQFINAIRDEAWLPAGYATPVIETAVAEVLEILVQPRKNLPEAIYGNEKKLTASQIRERVNRMVVYRHFANLLPRYMRKKGLGDLTKERCSLIIEKADEKVTARYTPLNWAQLLEPLFHLMNEKIDSNLLRLFFEDKNMPEVAHRFDRMNQPVNRGKLIETLSSPEPLDSEEYEDEESRPERYKTVELKKRPGSIELNLKEIEEKEAVLHKENDNLEGESVSIPLKNKSGKDRTGFQHEEISLNTFFEDNVEAGETGSEREIYVEEQEDKGSSLNDVFEEVEEEPQADKIEPSREKDRKKNDLKKDEDAGVQTEPVENRVNLREELKKEIPMWQRFMNPEELQSFAEKDEERSFDNDFREEPDSDSEAKTDSKPEPENPDLLALRNCLKDERADFIKGIFRGSEEAYEEALEKIAGKEGWRSASQYIEQEVFKHNSVDMYSERAVGFTDRLHSYFIERANV